MDRRTKSSVLWGVVGGLLYMVLIQGYVLATASDIGALVMVGMAIGVGLATTAVTYTTAPRFKQLNRQA